VLNILLKLLVLLVLALGLPYKMLSTMMLMDKELTGVSTSGISA